MLRPHQEKWRAQVREQLSALVAALARAGAEPADEVTVRESLRRLDDLFLLVVVGEFNAGKSVFVNALLGEALLEEGVLPTTTRIQVLRYGEERTRVSVDEAADVITAPVPVLREINIVDTPGTNAIERKHEAITRDFIPRADLIFFVTSADRPFTESERTFMERIREWGKKIVLVVNKIDIIERQEDRARIESFVREHGRVLTGASPEVFLVAAREALRHRLNSGAGPRSPGAFGDLERYVHETLDQEERIRLKLLSPLGVSENLTGKYLETAERQLAVLRDDAAAIDDIEGRLRIYREDMERGFRLRLADVDNVLHQLEARGHEFIEEIVRLGRVPDLIKKDKVRADFERLVVKDAPKQIERRVEEIIDWMVAADLEQWQTVRHRLAERQGRHPSHAMAGMARGFEYDRQRLIETVGRETQRTLEEYDQKAEAHRIAESVQAAVAGAAMLEVGAVGLGTLVTLVATSTAADITGLLAAGVLATLGFLVLPQRRRAAKKELREKVARLREELMNALTNHFQSEVDRSLRRLDEGIAPYTQFVRAERQRLGERRDEFSRIRDESRRLRNEIEPGDGHHR